MASPLRELPRTIKKLHTETKTTEPSRLARLSLGAPKTHWAAGLFSGRASSTPMAKNKAKELPRKKLKTSSPEHTIMRRGFGTLQLWRPGLLKLRAAGGFCRPFVLTSTAKKCANLRPLHAQAEGISMEPASRTLNLSSCCSAKYQHSYRTRRLTGIRGKAAPHKSRPCKPQACRIGGAAL